MTKMFLHNIPIKRLHLYIEKMNVEIEVIETITSVWFFFTNIALCETGHDPVKSSWLYFNNIDLNNKQYRICHLLSVKKWTSLWRSFEKNIRLLRKAFGIPMKINYLKKSTEIMFEIPKDTWAISRLIVSNVKDMLELFQPKMSWMYNSRLVLIWRQHSVTRKLLFCFRKYDPIIIYPKRSRGLVLINKILFPLIKNLWDLPIFIQYFQLKTCKIKSGKYFTYHNKERNIHPIFYCVTT